MSFKRYYSLYEKGFSMQKKILPLLLGLTTLLSLLSITFPWNKAHLLAKEDSSITVEKNLIYKKIGGAILKLDAYIPAGKGPFPAVILIHGGGWRQGNKFYHTVDARFLASKGYSAFSINYRLAPDHTFPACILDCKTAVRWVRTHAKEFKVDPKKIGSFGHSAGGHLSALLATTSGDLRLADKANLKSKDDSVQAAVAMAGVYNFHRGAFLFQNLMGGKKEDLPEKYKLGSPLYQIDKGDAPILLIHGDKDRLVPLRGAKVFLEALEKAGVPSQLLVLKGTGHIYQFNQASAKGVQEGMIQFYDRYLKERKN